MKLYCLLPLLALPLAAQVHFTPDQPGPTPDKIDITVDGKPFTTYYAGKDVGKPFLWPLRTADGKAITRRWPVEQNTGESHDHPHHRGLWFTYDDVNGIKFWENDPSYKRPNIGHIIPEKVTFKNGKTGVLTADFNWVAPGDKTVLKEHRVTTFHSGDPNLRIIDFDITLTAPEKVVFGDTKEGAFAIRLADSMTEKSHGGEMVNAEGKHGMKEVWGKRSNWVDYSGNVDGEKVGVAMFDAPSSARHPTYWHSRDYGLFALNPFGQQAFDPSQPESHWTVEPGKSVHFLWRVVIHPGDAESAHIADMYRRWSEGK